MEVLRERGAANGGDETKPTGSRLDISDIQTDNVFIPTPLEGEEFEFASVGTRDGCQLRWLAECLVSKSHFAKLLISPWSCDAVYIFVIHLTG